MSSFTFLIHVPDHKSPRHILHSHPRSNHSHPTLLALAPKSAVLFPAAAPASLLALAFLLIGNPPIPANAIPEACLVIPIDP